jgi:hypothetical protein
MGIHSQAMTRKRSHRFSTVEDLPCFIINILSSITQDESVIPLNRETDSSHNPKSYLQPDQVRLQNLSALRVGGSGERSR